MTQEGPRAIVPVAGPVHGALQPPGSKSLTNRALMASALAPGTSTITGALVAHDTDAMAGAVEAIGARVERDGDTTMVHGTGGKLAAGAVTAFANQSGTTARFLLPTLALGTGTYLLDGDDQLRARPMQDGIESVRRLGVEVAASGRPGHLPVVVTGGPARGGSLRVRGEISSQFLSGLLLAGPCFVEGLRLALDGTLVSRSYVTMTTTVMEAFGASVTLDDHEHFSVAPGGYRATTYAVEPDASSASYLFAAAALTGGQVRVDGLGTTSVQGDLAMLDVLEAMGATVERRDDSTTVTGPTALRGVHADLSDCSDLFPTLAIVAARATTASTFTGIGFIRAKESDRIAAVADGLSRCGAVVRELDDGLAVDPSPLHGAVIDPVDDHRIAMAFAVLGLVVDGMQIADPGCVAKTYPGFFADLEALGSPAR